MIGRRALLGAGLALAAGRALADAPMRLAWPRATMADLAVPLAREDGFFARAGIAVTLVEGAPTGADLAGRLGSGDADAVVAPVSLMLDPVRRGLDAKFTTGVSGGGLRLLAEKRSGLRHIEDLKHARIGVADLAGPAHLFFSIMARRKGIDPFEEIDWVVVAADEQERALRARRVDAVAATDPQAFFLLRAIRAVEIATNLSGSYRQRVSNALACSGAMLRERPGQTAALTRAVREAGAWAAGHARELATSSLVTGLAPRLSEADRLAMLDSERLGEQPQGAALVEDVAEYADELRLLGTFPFALNSERFAAGVCAHILA